MSLVRAVPPGRAGQLWLRRRLAVARRGAALLDRKVRILTGERERLALRVQHAGEEWRERAGEARLWLRRGGVLSGRRGLRPATVREPAVVSVAWRDVMGVDYPAEARCDVPDSPDDAPPPEGSAYVMAAEACRAALDAAARYGAAAAALSRVEHEIVATRQRLHAIEDRWIPRLEAEAARIRVSLEEMERADGVALRWAVAGPRETGTADGGEDEPGDDPGGPVDGSR